MIVSFDGKTPRIAKSALVSDMACIIGDVEIGEEVTVWPGAVIRADFGTIIVGNKTQIEDNAVIHGQVNIGSSVTIGHCAVVEGLKIGDNALIGNGAVILNDVEIGDQCIIGANAMVRAGMKIPPHSFVAGVPAEIKGEVTPEQASLMKIFIYPPEIIEKYKRRGIL